MKRDIKDFITYSMAQLFIIIVSIAISSLWARYTTKDEYGAYQLLLSFVGIFGIFSFPGLGLAMQISSANGKGGNLKLALFAKLKYSLIGSISLLLLGFYYYFYKHDMLLAYLFIISAPIYPLYPLNSLWENWLTGIRKINRLSFYFIVNSIISLCVTSFGLIFLNNIYITVFLLFLSIGILNTLIIGKTIKTSNTKIDKKDIRYGYIFSGAVVISMLSGLDKFVISEYISLSDVAIYGVAMALVSKIKILYIAINKLMATSILRAKSIKEAWDYIKFRLIFIWLLFAVVGFLGFFYIGDIITIIFTNKYNQSIIYAKWLWLIFALFRPIFYLNHILQTQKKIKISYVIESINSVGKLLLFVLLLPLLHLWGIVYATLIANVIITCVIAVYFYINLKNEKISDA